MFPQSLPRLATTCLLAALTLVVSPTADPVHAQGHGYDCAHGPDTYRVRNVAEWDRLNIRSAPHASSRIVGSIDAHGSGIHCLGPCEGKWCRISWRGIVGWTNMKFLGE